MGCDRYLELLSLRLDGVLTEAGERELEEHLTACPDCRAAGAQLAALRSAFDDWEEVPAPQGFAQGVMDRIRTEAGEKKMLTARSFQRDIYVEYPGSGVDDYAGVCSVDGAQETGDTPKIAAYAASGASEDGNGTYQKAAPGDGSSAVIRATPMVNTEVLTLDRMPEGAWELIPPETPVSPEGVHVTVELFEEIEQLAVEQGITASVTTSGEEAEEFVIVVLEESE